MVIGSATRQDVVIDTEVERASRQYLSGNVFRTFGVRPAIGRLLESADDVEPRAATSRSSATTIGHADSAGIPRGRPDVPLGEKHD